MPLSPLALMQGTLDLLVFRTLIAGPMHGYGIATRARGADGGNLAVEDAACTRHCTVSIGRAWWRRSGGRRRTTAAPATTR